MIDAIKWVLLTPHPFVIILAFATARWLAPRRWGWWRAFCSSSIRATGPGRWVADLVLTSCVFCMGIGVPIGIALAHRPQLYEWVRRRGPW